jgi:hypothetical protein
MEEQIAAIDSFVYPLGGIFKLNYWIEFECL